MTIAALMRNIIAGLVAFSCAVMSAFALPPEGANDPERIFIAYVQATRTKDIPALTRIIADDYMTINGESKLATKNSEIEDAKKDPPFDKMEVDEIHSLVVRDTAVISGLINAVYTNASGKPVQARVRVMATFLKRHGMWQLVADESAPTH